MVAIEDQAPKATEAQNASGCSASALLEDELFSSPGNGVFLLGDLKSEFYEVFIQ